MADEDRYREYNEAQSSRRIAEQDRKRAQDEAAWGLGMVEALGQREARGWHPDPMSSPDQRTVVRLKDGTELVGAMVGPVGAWLAFDGRTADGEYVYHLINRHSIAVITFADTDPDA